MASLLSQLPPIHILQHLIFLIFIHIPSQLSSNIDYYRDCTNLINCGGVTKIGFPFWGQNRPKECGHPLMQFTCQSDISYITIKDVMYQVLDSNSNEHTLRITRVDYLQQGICPSKHVNTTLDTNLFVYESDYKNLTLFYGCAHASSTFDGFIPCNSSETSGEYVYPEFGSPTTHVFCKTSVVIPVSQSLINSSVNDFTKIHHAIMEGFVVRWIVGVEECNKCESSGGACGIDLNSNHTTCYYCKDGTCSKPLPNTQAPPSDRRKGQSRALVLIIVPTIVSVTLFFFCYYLIKRKSRKSIKSLLRENFGNESDTLEHLQFNLATLKAATNNFSSENRIGKGGFGEVYKGILVDGRQIAVKRLSKCSMQGVNEFKNEIMVVAKLQHRNLVTLIGFCLEEQNKILIYEYVSNKSLDYFLFDSQPSKMLSWFERYNIIGGIARGILYLHEHSRLKVIHRDLKPSNVLLDENMTPKISDFGLAKIVEINQDQTGTNRIAGTFGYMPPEYAMLGQFSEKSDVFSFGVMVLEIITGKKNLSSYEPHRIADGLLNYVWRQWRDQVLMNILEPSIKESCSEIEVIKCIQIGLLCVQQNPDARPTMSTVVSYFSSYLVELPTPEEPAFFVHDKIDPTIFAEKSSGNQLISRIIPFSVNEISVSDIFPR